MHVGLFSTPLLVHKFSKHEEYTKRIELFERSSNRPLAWICDVYTTYPQVSDDDEHLGGVIPDLKKDLLDDVKGFMREYGISDQIVFDNFWYNAYYEDQGQEAHNHLCPFNMYNPLWSGVYFHRNCYPGSFLFQKTNTDWRSQQINAWHETKLAEYYNEMFYPPISDGDILLFPPYLLHAVKADERNAEDMRLTFSFNVIIGMEKEAT
jgi:hypothetical protein